MEYNDILISEDEAKEMAYDLFQLKGEIKKLPGEIDFNFKINTSSESYILKISRPNEDLQYLDFQDKIIYHLEHKSIQSSHFPISKRQDNGNGIYTYTDQKGRVRYVRLLTWIDGRLFSNTNSKDTVFLQSLGKVAGHTTNMLNGFYHNSAERIFDWDLSNALWTEAYHHLFNEEDRYIIQYFTSLYKDNLASYNKLPKSVIHNDANDNNIIISSDKIDQKVIAIIDFGDAVFSQTINDLAVACAYAIMNCEDPLSASCAIVSGYHSQYRLTEEEILHLYYLIAMRLIISVTKSAINKEKEPDNIYLQISEKSAWQLLHKWCKVNPSFAHYNYRNACGYTPCPQYDEFVNYCQSNSWSIANLLDLPQGKKIKLLDLSISSKFLGHFDNYIDSEAYSEKIKNHIGNDVLFIGGYGEARSIYTTDAYKIKRNEGYEHRTVHMGIDLWTDAYTPVLSIDDGVVMSVYNNDNDKDYGPTIIIKHERENLTFYTLYGHLSKSSLDTVKVGEKVSKGQFIAYLGAQNENGNWAPHLHFQILLDMLDCTHDFYGVALPSLWPVYKSICPDPNLMLNIEILKQNEAHTIFEDRKKHLGRSLSISYKKPLHIVRGQMQYLIDIDGQKYIDTVNNVAHVGHEHPHVVNTAIDQMQILNTNTRYLHEEITQFAKELLATFPPELSVVHFVNSGSEANELALRMAKAKTGKKDIIALEIGYHGNTQGCIDISSYKFDGKGGRGKPDQTHIVPLPDEFRGLYRGKDKGELYATHVDEIIRSLKLEGKAPAAFIAESIVSCGGQIPLPQGYLKAAYQYVRAAGGVCIADEVQVGFGRVGKKFWGFELQDVVPDIVTLGKPIGNGHPLGAVVCTAEIADAFANGMEYFNTFGGNPVSCAIGRAVLQTIKEEDLQSNAFELGEYMKDKLRSLSSSYPQLADVRGDGLFLGIEFVDKDYTPLTEYTSYIANKMKDYKVLMSVDGPYNNVLKIKPPMCITKRDVDYILDSLEIILNEVF
jgi:4-aminobutyrate aminotransferase-like enzyme/Ser/Thr protein kinase RdoA (MazF antagonist)